MSLETGNGRIPDRGASDGCDTTCNTPRGPAIPYFVGVGLGRPQSDVVSWLGRRDRPWPVLLGDASVPALRPYVVGDCLVAFDAALVVANHRQRHGEAALTEISDNFEAYPANTEKLRVCRGAARLGLAAGIRTTSRRAIEAIRTWLRWRRFGYPARYKAAAMR